MKVQEYLTTNLMSETKSGLFEADRVYCEVYENIQGLDVEPWVVVFFCIACEFTYMYSCIIILILEFLF